MAPEPQSLGRGRTVLRMVRDNRPWWLITDLSAALAAALATAAFSLVTNTIWQLGDRMEWPRLVGLGIAAVAGLAIWLVVAHGLWERTRGPEERDRVRVANRVTALTLLVGLTFFYAALFVLVLGAALLLIEEG